MKLKLKRLLFQFLGLFPSKLPQGMTEFNEYVDSIIANYDLPTLDRKSIVWGISATILRLGETAAYKSKHYFVLILRAGAAKQIAGAAFTEIKEQQKAEATAQAVANETK